MEVTIIDNTFLSHVPSLIAAAGLHLARKMLGKTTWVRKRFIHSFYMLYTFKNANLVRYSGYKESEVIPVTNAILSFLEKPMKYEAIYKKYATRKFMKVGSSITWFSRYP